MGSVFFFCSLIGKISLHVYDSSCLMFYQQYINSYNKLNLLGATISYFFQRITSCFFVNDFRKVIY